MNPNVSSRMILSNANIGIDLICLPRKVSVECNFSLEILFC
jgi:hypothetical protein